MFDHDTVLILDFGSQFTQLIARRVRELNIYSEVRPCTITDNEITRISPRAIIISGSSESVNDVNPPQIPKIIYEMGIPILGICYGQQAICKDFGGTVSSTTSRSYGETKLKILKDSELFKNFWRVGENHIVWMSHGDSISNLPKDFKVIAKTDQAPYAFIQHNYKNIFGIQFHPEVYHTPDGIKLIKTFLVEIAGLKQKWKARSFIKDKISEIKKTVGNEKVVLAFSGGVDSTVAAILLHKAIGKQLQCIFVDNGLLRHNEVKEITENLQSKFFDLQIKFVDASDKFLSHLKGVVDPEDKRKVIGRVFIEVFKGIIEDTSARYLGQGTIYPDIIESATISTGKKITIKSHHNVGGLPEEMGTLKLIEPLRLLFKDEVRLIGKQLGIPNDILHRHPFPGPGLGVRIIGEVTKEKCTIVRKADFIFINILKNTGWYHRIWQAYAALLPVKTVGVMGDTRTYNYICVLRGVTSTDGMTADYASIPHEILSEAAKQIVNEVDGINRVLYDITSKPPGTIELE